MSYYVEGNNSELVKEIMGDKKLLSIFMEWVRADDDEKKNFEFIRYEDTNRLEIKKKVPALEHSHNF